MEECQSGWLEQSWKLSNVHAFRGFESHLLLFKVPRGIFYWVVWDENPVFFVCFESEGVYVFQVYCYPEFISGSYRNVVNSPSCLDAETSSAWQNKVGSNLTETTPKVTFLAFTYTTFALFLQIFVYKCRVDFNLPEHLGILVDWSLTCELKN